MPKEKVIGIVAEYNPFHKGHAYQISTAKEQLGADKVVAVMSGNFTQRGEAAILDKWQRTELALAGGVDLVLELPTIYALRSSEVFGRNAVGLLAATGLVTHLVFGCETTEPEFLATLAQEKLTKEQLSPYLNKGLTYGAAVTALLEHKYGAKASLLKKPNNILALAYYQALQEIIPSLEPVAIERQGADYKDSTLHTAFPSAQGLRQALLAQVPHKELQKGFPAKVWHLLNSYRDKQSLGINEAARWLLLKHKLSTSTAAGLATASDCSEGLENKLLTGITASNYAEFLQLVKSKRYPLTRLQRLTYQLLLSTEEVPYGTTQDVEPAYLRVLGFTHKGQQLLKAMKKSAALPIITKMHKNELYRQPPNFQKSLQLDIAATNLYDLLTDTHGFNRDYTTSPLRYEEGGSYAK